MAVTVDSGGTTRALPQLNRMAFTRAGVVYAVLSVVALGTYYLLPRAGVAQAVLLTSVNFAAAVAALRAARRTHGSARMVWAGLGSAMVLTGLANGSYYAYPLVTGQVLPFPSLVDLLFLAMYPCFAFALLALGRQTQGRHERADLLDSAILSVAGGAVMWTFVIHPVLAAPGETSFEHLVSAGYPLMDLLVFAVAVRLLVSGLLRSGASVLILLSFSALLVSDIIYALELLNGTYSSGGPCDGIWLATYALIGIAAMSPRPGQFSAPRVSTRNSISRGRLAFMGASVLVGPLLLIVDGTDVSVISAASALSFLLVMVRLTGLNRRLGFVSHELEHQAFHDSLTGLPNRALFYDRVEHLHRSLQRAPHGYAILMLDLDDFKDINDTLGHGTGDDVLLAVSKRLTEAIRPGDTAARLGGDEFGIILEDLRGATAAAIVAQRVIELLREPLLISGRLLPLSATIGIALSSEATQGASEVVRNADVALYVGKAAGKDRYELYRDEMQATAGSQRVLAQQLRDGIAGGELVLHYQPRVDTLTGCVVGVEALVRWNHPVRGLLAPDSFIALAEETGVIVDLDSWVLEAACRQMRDWTRAGLRPITLSVNISGRNLERPGLLARVRRVLDNTGLDPARLELELTESAAVKQQGQALSTLRDVRTLGVRIAIDDFGTGYSMLSRLQELPFDTLKIDRSFVSRITSADADSPIVSAAVAMARGLDLEVVAEGVETEEQRLSLARRGTDQLQGYLASRPVEAGRIPPMLGQPLLPGFEDPRSAALDGALLVASDRPQGDDLIRGLLSELQRLTGLDAVYLTNIDWVKGKQVIRFSHNRGHRSAPEGLVLPWPNTLSLTALVGPATGAGGVVEASASGVGQQQQSHQTFVSVPVLLDDGSMFGTLCAASTSDIAIAHTGLQVMRIFASVVAAHLSSQSGSQPMTGDDHAGSGPRLPVAPTPRRLTVPGRSAAVPGRARPSTLR